MPDKEWKWEINREALITHRKIKIDIITMLKAIGTSV
jgi:hypothetical protein